MGIKEIALDEKDKLIEQLRKKDYLAEQLRNHILDVSRGIVAGYRVGLQSESPNTELSYPTQLAYLRSRNILNINQLLGSYYRKDSQEKIDKISKEALRVHNWGKDVYWRAIAKVQEHVLYLAVRENVNDKAMVPLCKNRIHSQGKIDEIETRVKKGEPDARFPGLVVDPEVRVNECIFDFFRELRREYSPIKLNGKFLCKVVELAHRSAVDTLALKACFDSQNYVTFNQAANQYDRARAAHQERGLAFWEPMHEVDLFCYDRISEEVLSLNKGLKKAGKEIKEILEDQARLREKSRESEQKLTKLDKRQIAADGETHEETIELLGLIRRTAKGPGSELDPRTREDLLQLLLQLDITERQILHHQKA